MLYSFTFLQYQSQSKPGRGQKTESHGVEYGLQAIQIGEVAGNSGGSRSDPEAENKERAVPQTLPMLGHVL